MSKTSGRVHELLQRRHLEDNEFRRRWQVTFDETIERCREVAVERNRIVHSAYIHLESGDDLLGVLRSDASRDPERPGVTFDQEWVDPASFREPLARLVDSYVAVVRCKRQLTHWV